MILRDYQQNAVNACWRYWSAGGISPIVVAPTGAGKSVIIAEIIKKIQAKVPTNQIACVTHVAELVVQNRERLLHWAPELESDIGIVSGNLGDDTDKPIIFATVQTLVNRLKLDTRQDSLLIIDEAHRIPRDSHTQYGQVIARMKANNPKLRILGMTATPYRMDSGLLHEGDDSIFDGIAYDIELETLIDQGYLVQPASIAGDTSETDLTKLKTRLGEYTPSSQAEALGNLELVVKDALNIIGNNYFRILWFAPNIETAEKVNAILQSLDETSEVVVSTGGGRDAALKKFKQGLLGHLVNVNILTTGVDIPEIDCIVLLRATQSTSLYVQMCGRGLRTAKDKDQCLILDYGDNVERHGFLDDPHIGSARKSTTKKCPECGHLNRIREAFCTACGHEFPPPKPREAAKPKEKEYNRHKGAIVSWAETPHNEKVDDIKFTSHFSENSKTGLATVKTTYYYKDFCAFTNEWLCPLHPVGGFAHKKFIERCRQLGLNGEIPTFEDIHEAINWLGLNVDKPDTIQLARKKGQKYKEVIRVNAEIN